MLDFSELVLNTQEPVYQQIHRFVKQQILLGKAKRGDRLPSRREMAMQLRINPNTAQKAFRAMEAEGLVLTPQNSVSLLYYDEQMLEQMQQQMRAELVQAFAKEAKANGFLLDEVLELVQAYWEEDEDEA